MVAYLVWMVNQPTFQIIDECLSCFSRPLAELVTGDEFGIEIEREVQILAAQFRVVLLSPFQLPFFLAAERPDFIQFQMPQMQVIQVQIEPAFARLTEPNKYTHDRVAVNSGDAFSTTDRVAFNQAPQHK